MHIVRRNEIDQSRESQDGSERNVFENTRMLINLRLRAKTDRLSSCRTFCNVINHPFALENLSATSFQLATCSRKEVEFQTLEPILTP